ncbi:hypothetical protein POSPLADRAFT_1061260 [Postia placenta MAD-698-R-SB12]|uniref:Uncharacterized protein n=1 Tax=Postia placenta MAD-698-R-SB12 TaxID=670580 RepID=A0A1X6MN93_9APHY|nr:hypothetical protein POSPLADRAFT_1061260 [Postia placenta MAD-698-R-SB12]OSX57563.1 hypothetical protein POSPLADRAFT_1061260 [Postia placenta MAD-698-R-SB12]
MHSPHPTTTWSKAAPEREYTFDTASLTRVHTEDRSPYTARPDFDHCKRSTIFDAGLCDSPASSRQNSVLAPAKSASRTSSPLCSRADTGTSAKSLTAVSVRCASPLGSQASLASADYHETHALLGRAVSRMPSASAVLDEQDGEQHNGAGKHIAKQTCTEAEATKGSAMHFIHGGVLKRLAVHLPLRK